MSTFSIFIALILVVCFLLILVVMVQNPKGGGLSSSFGGGAQQLGGVQKTTDFLDRSTWVLGTLLVVLILLSNFSLGSDQAVQSNESRLLDSDAIEQVNTQSSTPAEDILEVPVETEVTDSIN